MWWSYMLINILRLNHLILSITTTNRPCWTGWRTLLNASARSCCWRSLIRMNIWHLIKCSIILLLLLLLILSVIVLVLKILLSVAVVIKIINFRRVSSERVVKILVAISILRRSRMQRSCMVVATSTRTCYFILNLNILMKLMPSISKIFITLVNFCQLITSCPWGEGLI